MDHAFSIPLRYFEFHQLPPGWPNFLIDFTKHWPTHEDHTYVDFVRDGLRGKGAARGGSARWRRLAEFRSGGAKSVFHFDVQGSVAKSTHSGLLWLLFLREHLGAALHFRPFDGWQVPAGRSAIAEVYPRLWKNNYPQGARTGDQHDAYSVAAWLREADADGRLRRAFRPELSAAEKAVAGVEGWVLGVE
jgi:hypothetical protein